MPSTAWVRIPPSYIARCSEDTVGSCTSSAAQGRQVSHTLSARFLSGKDVNTRGQFSTQVRTTRARQNSGGAAYHRQRHIVQAVAGSSEPDRPRLIGCGGVGLDYLASVPKYPQPDDKIRSERLEVQGGGNCGNALTAASRLGLDTMIVTKVGDDSAGQSIVSGLEEEGINCDLVASSPGPSPFTYIIVDKSEGTRTCIHTPGPPFEPEEIDKTSLRRMLEGVALVYFDGRCTEAALEVARCAEEAGVPMLVEAERLRPNLDRLLHFADYVVTSKHYPSDWTEEEEVGEAMAAMLQGLPRARFLLTTLGSRGSVLMERLPAPPSPEPSPSSTPSQLLHHLMDQVQGSAAEGGAAGEIGLPEVRTAGPVAMPGAPQSMVQVQYATACPLDAAQVVDTTGAGDAFIGSVCYALCSQLPRDRMLQLASYVAAVKCGELGPRPGLPHRQAVPPELL